MPFCAFPKNQFWLEVAVLVDLAQKLAIFIAGHFCAFVAKMTFKTQKPKVPSSASYVRTFVMAGFRNTDIR